VFVRPLVVGRGTREQPPCDKGQLPSLSQQPAGPTNKRIGSISGFPMVGQQIDSRSVSNAQAYLKRRGARKRRRKWQATIQADWRQTLHGSRSLRADTEVYNMQPFLGSRDLAEIGSRTR